MCSLGKELDVTSSRVCPIFIDEPKLPVCLWGLCQNNPVSPPRRPADDRRGPDGRDLTANVSVHSWQELQTFARDGGSHRDAGQMHRVILDFGELPRLGRRQ